MIDILRFNEGLEVVLKDFRKVILQLGTTEVLEDLLPIWWILWRGGEFICMSFDKPREVARTS